MERLDVTTSKKNVDVAVKMVDNINLCGRLVQ